MVIHVRRRVSNESGASAIELALLAPFLLAMLLFMTELGLALQQRMTMNQILRIGADAAMGGADTGRITEILGTAVDDHATGRMRGLTLLEPERVFRCPGAEDVVVDRTASCPSGGSPDAYVDLGADLPYDSLLMGDRLDITLRSRLQVQVLNGAQP